MTAPGRQELDEEATIRVAVAALADQFGSTDASHIEVIVRRSLEECLARSRVKDYVGVIVQRQARDELERLHSSRETPSTTQLG